MPCIDKGFRRFYHLKSVSLNTDQKDDRQAVIFSVKEHCFRD